MVILNCLRVMRNKDFAIVIGLVLSFCQVHPSEVAPTKVPAEAKTETKLKHRPFNGTIKAVSKPSRAIVLRGAKAQTFFVIPETKIKRDGQPITFEQIVEGETLGGYARQAANGRWEALTLNLGQKKKEEPQPTSKPATNAPPAKVK